MRTPDRGRALAPRLVAALLLVLSARPALADPPPAPVTAPLASAPPASEPLISDDQARALRFMAGVTLTGLGVFGFVLGGAFGVRAVRDKDAIGTHCDQAARCDVTGFTLGSEARGSAVIATASLAIGLGAGAAGVALVITGTPKKTRAAAWISPAPGGLAVGGRW
jgi:hypothetical protein